MTSSAISSASASASAAASPSAVIASGAWAAGVRKAEPPEPAAPLVEAVSRALEQEWAVRAVFNWQRDVSAALEAQGFVFLDNEGTSVEEQSTTATLKSRQRWYDGACEQTFVFTAGLSAVTPAALIGYSALTLLLQGVDDQTMEPLREGMVATHALVVSQSTFLGNTLGEVRSNFEQHVRTGLAQLAPALRQEALAQFVAKVCACQSR